MDLTPFCSIDNPLISKPFSSDGYSYATDGHMLIRVPLQPDIENTIPGIVRLDGIIIEPQGDKDIAFPTYGPPKMRICMICGGGKTSHECPECDGEGYVEFDNEFNDYECECKTCGGEGLVAGGYKKCTVCEGKGTAYAERYPYVDIGDVRLSIKLLEKIKNLPGVAIGATDGVDRRMVTFHFDGGDGVIMVMSK